MGRPPALRMGFGAATVRSLMRVPRPAANMTALGMILPQVKVGQVGGAGGFACLLFELALPGRRNRLPHLPACSIGRCHLVPDRMGHPPQPHTERASPARPAMSFYVPRMSLDQP